MLRCFWCGRWFRNKQALRAHLKHCAERGGEFRYGPYAQTKQTIEAMPASPKEETHVDWCERMMQIEKMKRLLEEFRSKRGNE
jgi:hypothetical protein